jgi:hypothetical protein
MAVIETEATTSFHVHRNSKCPEILITPAKGSFFGRAVDLMMLAK